MSSSSLIRSLADERARRREVRLRQLQQERDEREAVILARIPRLAEIKQELTQIGLDLARAALRLPGRPGVDVEHLTARGAALVAERAQLLARVGIDPDELNVRWDCPVCENTGWVKPVITPDQDTVPPPVKCRCLLREEMEDLYRFSGLSRPMQDQTFARFDLGVYPPEARDVNRLARDHCLRFAQAVVAGAETDNLLIMGDVGLGKTFLATAIANYVIQHHKIAVYFTFPEFLDLLRRQRWETDEEDRTAAMRRLLDSDLLILDDLGAEKLTEFVGQELFNVLNQRINQRKPLVVSTNLEFGDLDEYYGRRISSRLIGTSEALRLEGQDVRLVMRRRRAAGGQG